MASNSNRIHERNSIEKHLTKSAQKYGEIISCDDTLDSYEERRMDTSVTNEMRALPMTLEGDHGGVRDEKYQ